MALNAQQVLERELEARGLSDQAVDLWRYMQLLQQWNRAYNLVAPVDDLTLLNRHVMDCLAAREFIQPGRSLDVGTGAGLPGLVLAVTMPSTEWVLLDSNGKKTRFCEQAVHELNLENVRVVQQRAADHSANPCYANIISRAFSQAADFVNMTRHLMCRNGRILAMKGRVDEEEKANARATGLRLEINSMQVPGLDGQRHMMVFQQ